MNSPSRTGYRLSLLLNGLGAVAVVALLATDAQLQPRQPQPPQLPLPFLFPNP